MLARARAQVESGRFVVVITLASSLAWMIAWRLGLSQPPIAAVAATLSVQLTSQHSIKSGVTRGAGIVGGMLIAMGTYRITGSQALAVPVIVLGGLVGSRLLRLNDETGRSIAATGLVMMLSVTSLTLGAVGGYALTTLVGVAVGALATPFAHRAGAAVRARMELNGLGRSVADLLGQLAEASTRAYDRTEAESWLAAGRRLGDEVARVSTVVRAAIDEARWSVSNDSGDVAALEVSLRALTLSVGQVAGIARAVYDHAQVGDLGEIHGLSEALTYASRAFCLHSHDDGGDETDLAGAVASTRRRLHRVATALSDVDDATTLVTAGSIVADLTRMIDQLDRTSEALLVEREVPTGWWQRAPGLWRDRLLVSRGGEVVGGDPQDLRDGGELGARSRAAEITGDDGEHQRGVGTDVGAGPLDVGVHRRDDQGILGADFAEDGR